MFSAVSLRVHVISKFQNYCTFTAPGCVCKRVKSNFLPTHIKRV